MAPVDYWDLLYKRENDIRKRLADAHLPLTEDILEYFTRLEQGRLTAVASNLPVRGTLSRKKWLNRLYDELEGVWKPRPGMLPETPVIIARKQDYEKAIDQEIRAVRRET